MDLHSLPTVRPIGSAAQPSDQVAHKTEMERAAIEFEAVFLAEMLRHSGLGQARDAFGGGAGEEAFSGMMTREWARSLAEKGGIGLAERLLQDLQTQGGVNARRE
ncbi:MAG: rod-binding protein [Pseudomonadota bacterium]